MNSERFEIRLTEEDKRAWTRESIKARLSLGSWIKMIVSNAISEPRIWQKETIGAKHDAEISLRK